MAALIDTTLLLETFWTLREPSEPRVEYPSLVYNGFPTSEG